VIPAEKYPDYHVVRVRRKILSSKYFHDLSIAASEGKTLLEVVSVILRSMKDVRVDDWLEGYTDT